MPKKSIVLYALSLFITIGCKTDRNESATELNNKRPNIVLIIADDQGWGDLSSSGNTNLSTPHIDALAKNGVSFQNFYVQPVCSPTRAELLTGRHFPRLGVFDTSAGGERMNLGETTLAEILKNGGYATAAYGKWHNGMQPPYHPNSRGFDDYYGFTSGHWGNYFSPMLEHNGEITKGEGFLVDDLTTKGLEFISEHENESFFLYLPYNTPHSPMQVPDAYWNRFENKDLAMTYHGEEAEDQDFTKAALAMVENIDYNVGRITQRLQELDLEKNTIIIYMTDNGPNGFRWNGGMRGKKGWVDEGGVRSPFFVQWKDSLPEGKEINEIASAIDILPTLINIVGLDAKTKKPLDGKDLTPLLWSESHNWQPRLVYNHWAGKTSVRSQKYRLDNENRLYDMVNDHGQTTDISQQFQKIADSLIKAKNEWLAAVNPKFPRDEDNRPFTLGSPDHQFTQIPARDGTPHGHIARSNRFPNNTFFTHWKSEKDSISWNVEVLADGEFEVTLYYTCAAENIGPTIELGFGDSKIATKIMEAHDPPLTGMENDRTPRMESYVKDFKPVKLGTIALKKGRGNLTLKALEIPGDKAIDVRLLMFSKK
ncbi:arylsulfatase [Ulvibacterium sp.]|uniref:arylsulfatase n=1 Tax=Ulvibacterium sp. TaxID=2665914 RepID=UPI002628230C|nr:arylsulfatase [Ulvibacterium sp.]